MVHQFAYQRHTFLSHYHQRSNVETTFSMIKAKFGDSLRSKSDVGQVNEVLCKVVCHNLPVLIASIHELGLDAPSTGGRGPLARTCGSPLSLGSSGPITDVAGKAPSAA
jgi:hypothetical protein